jgi:hypothetical protein
MKTANFKSARLPDCVCALLLVSFALAIAYPRWRAGIDWRDEGLLAYGSVRVLHGQIPHRDFVSLQPALSFYTTAGIFKFAGTSLGSLRCFGVVIFLLLPLLIYGIARSFIGPILSFAAAAPSCILGLPYCSFVPLPVWQGITASLLAVLLFLRALLSNRQWLAFPSGLISAGSLFLRHDQAIYTIVSLVVLGVTSGAVRRDTVARGNLNRALRFWLLGMAVVSIPLIVIWWKIGAIPEMFRQLILFPITTYRKTSSLPFPRLSAAKSVVESATVLLFYIPLLVQAIAAVYLLQSLFRRRFRVREAVFTFFLVWSALFYLQVTIRSDITHLLMTLPPVFLLIAFGWSIVREKIASYRNIDLISSSVVAFVAGSFLWMVRSAALPNVAGENEQLKLERGGIRISQASAIAAFIQRLQADVPATRSILALPYQPMFYFLCERRNPTRWNYLWPGDQTQGDQEQFIAEAERDPPAVVLLAEQQQFAAFAPTILNYIETHYIRADGGGSLAIYVRPETE